MSASVGLIGHDNLSADERHDIHDPANEAIAHALTIYPDAFMVWYRTKAGRVQVLVCPVGKPELPN